MGKVKLLISLLVLIASTYIQQCSSTIFTLGCLMGPRTCLFRRPSSPIAGGNNSGNNAATSGNSTPRPIIFGNNQGNLPGLSGYGLPYVGYPYQPVPGNLLGNNAQIPGFGVGGYPPGLQGFNQYPLPNLQGYNNLPVQQGYSPYPFLYYYPFGPGFPGQSGIGGAQQNGIRVPGGPPPPAAPAVPAPVPAAPAPAVPAEPAPAVPPPAPAVPAPLPAVPAPAGPPPVPAGPAPVPPPPGPQERAAPVPPAAPIQPEEAVRK